MKIKQAFQAIAITAIATIILLIFPTSFVFAADNQSNQSLNRSALLISPNPDRQINIYPKPDRHQRRVGQGLSGDRVTVLEQVGSNEGYTWNHIRFDAPPHQEGWVQEDAISFSDSQTAPSQFMNLRQGRSGNRYFGDRQNSDRNHQRNQQYINNN